TLRVEFDELRPVSFLVVDELPHEALIGVDVLMPLKATIAFGEGSLVIGGRRFAIRTDKKGKRCTAAALSAARDCVVPARQGVIVPVKGPIHALVGPAKKEVMVTVSHHYGREMPRGLHVASSINNFSDNAGFVVIGNSTDKAV